jgi:S1-C subfamily serine protease
MAKPDAPLPPAPGWLGLGYTYNVTGTPAVRVVWLFVRQIAFGGPADRAGLKVHDVITAINGKNITFRDELETLNFFTGVQQGQRVQLRIRRGISESTITIIAGAPPLGMAERRRINTAVASAARTTLSRRPAALLAASMAAPALADLRD